MKFIMKLVSCNLQHVTVNENAKSEQGLTLIGDNFVGRQQKTDYNLYLSHTMTCGVRNYCHLVLFLKSIFMHIFEHQLLSCTTLCTKAC